MKSEQYMIGLIKMYPSLEPNNTGKMSPFLFTTKSLSIILGRNVTNTGILLSNDSNCSLGRYSNKCISSTIYRY